MSKRMNAQEREELKNKIITLRKEGHTYLEITSIVGYSLKVVCDLYRDGEYRGYWFPMLMNREFWIKNAARTSAEIAKEIKMDRPFFTRWKARVYKIWPDLKQIEVEAKRKRAQQILGRIGFDSED